MMQIISSLLSSAHVPNPTEKAERALKSADVFFFVNPIIDSPPCCKVVDSLPECEWGSALNANEKARCKYNKGGGGRVVGS